MYSEVIILHNHISIICNIIANMLISIVTIDKMQLLAS